MTEWLITIILEKKDTVLDHDAIEFGSKKALEKEFSDDEEKAVIKEIQVGEIIG